MQDIEKLNRFNFRAICDSISRPGSINTLQKAFDSYSLAMASTLLYSEVSYINLTDEDFWVLHSLCNAKQENEENADYIFTNNLNTKLIESAKKGSFKDPEFSASIIYCYDERAELKQYRLSGAGIESSVIQGYPMAHEVAKAFLEANSNFPIGLEIYFLNIQNGNLMALSRTTNMEAI